MSKPRADNRSHWLEFDGSSARWTRLCLARFYQRNSDGGLLWCNSVVRPRTYLAWCTAGTQRWTESYFMSDTRRDCWATPLGFLLGFRSAAAWYSIFSMAGVGVLIAASRRTFVKKCSEPSQWMLEGELGVLGSAVIGGRDHWQRGAPGPIPLGCCLN